MDLTPIKSILVPVDFSDNSSKAVEFAARIAESLSCKVLLHYVHPVAVVVSGEHMIGSMEKELKQQAMKEMERYVSAFREKFPKANFVTGFSQGLIPDEIVRYSTEKNADLIIMGTRGAHGLGATLFGSNTANVISRSTVPVLTVPEGAAFTGIKKVLFATTFLENDFQTLYHLCELIKPFNPEIEVLHVQQKNEEAAGLHLAEFAEQVKANIFYKNISFRIIEGEDIEKALEDYVQQSGIDIIALASKRRNFFEKLTERSLSRKMAFHPRIPLIIFHSFNKSSYALF